jgi:hypothetical protein
MIVEQSSVREHPGLKGPVIRSSEHPGHNHQQVDACQCQELINPIDSVSAFFFIVLFYSCTFYDIQVLLYFFLIGSFKLSLYFFCL